VSHLLAVTALVLEAGGGEDEAIAALLHDAAEDAGGRERLDEIADRFGDGVAAIVEACSDTLVQPKPPWPERKAAYVARVRGERDVAVLRVSAADKLHNARALLADVEELGDDAFLRFGSRSAGQPTKAGQLWYLRSLADAYRGRLPGRLPAELDRVLAELAARIDADAAGPLHVQSFPAGHALHERFPERRLLAAFEGGAVHAADAGGLAFLIVDEGTLADFLDDDPDLVEALIGVYAFADDAARAAFVAGRGWPPSGS
jgi:hypothetical protein